MQARVAILMACASLFAKDQSGPEQKAEKQISALDKAWVAAEVQHDQKTLERILDEALVVTYTSGQTIGRKEFIERLLSRPIPPFEFVHESIHVHGDTVVVIDRFGEGLRTKSIWVAVKKNGQWRVVAEQFVSIQQAEKQ